MVRMRYKFMGLLIIIFVLTSCDIIQSGSYPRAQSYRFEVESPQQLIAAIKDFKQKNPYLEVWTRNENGDSTTLDNFSPRHVDFEEVLEGVKELYGEQVEGEIRKIYGTDIDDSLRGYYVNCKFKICLNDSIIIIHTAVHTISRPVDLLFYGVSSINSVGSLCNFKDINSEDLTREENKYYKQVFEDSIVSKIRKFVAASQNENE